MRILPVGDNTPLSDSSFKTVMDSATTFSLATVTLLSVTSIFGVSMDNGSVAFVAFALMRTSPLFATKFIPLILTSLKPEAMLNTGFPSPAVRIVVLSPIMLMSFAMLMPDRI